MRRNYYKLMGYFSNGTEGAMFEHKYCSRCVHENTEKGCPVMMAHVLFAYKLCNEKDNEGKQILDLLIPESENGLGNEQCAMFHLKKDAADPEQFKLPLCLMTTALPPNVLTARSWGVVPHTDKAFGPVIASLKRDGLIERAGYCQRKKGHGTSGGVVWRLKVNEGVLA